MYYLLHNKAAQADTANVYRLHRFNAQGMVLWRYFKDWVKIYTSTTFSISLNVYFYLSHFTTIFKTGLLGKYFSLNL